ncbi:CusA/CzcA family heavy metal efflux RND transporter [Pedobacter metabolipauper]|uniref:Cobalt-zinc-cadmium resistance protein CzcA n=1 Tax=Pedobacter metabolipauper TaxID=425513 RepID=A0A4R6SV17_9SPHI|nr:CusA/CzcA family heavy metal efflux RND transporter [Pedobacter metabolipauper]TDQ08590.1 cobalt-zinc-cadmium resistance protein CzcA [Pedobacter metabolipauper]
MLNYIIRFSINNKLIIGALVFALIVWGVYSIRQLPIDAVPDITNNQVQIITTSPSNGAEDIERFVTFPVEQTMATIPGIQEVRSFSRFGLSVVTVVFKENIEIYWARQQVSERLSDAVKAIPDGMGSPEMAPLTTGLGEIYQYVIHTKKGYENKYDATALRSIQDWIVRRQLLGVEGIADVSSFGGFLKQYEIALNPDRLKSMEISIADVFEALKKNNQNTGGAYIDKKPNAYFIRSEGLIKSIQDIENIVVHTNKNSIPVLIRDVASVRLGTATRYGAMTRNDEGEVVGAIVMMLKGANSSKVIASVKERMAQIEKTLPEGVVIEPFLDRTKLVNNAIRTVITNLAEGALIVIFVLVLLLGNLRAGLIVASVIPLAMLFAICLMNLFGVSGNLMSLGAIDFGLIVDGAVIIVEATLHHLGMRKGRDALSQQQMDQEVFLSSSKIRNSAAFGELIILIVYLPILALIGTEGKMFKPMAQTVSFAVIGAFILSLTYVPMMSALFLSKKNNHKPNSADKIMAFFHRVYTPMLNFSLRSKALVVSIAGILLVISLILFSRMGSEFIPTLEEGDFAVETRVLTGSSLSQTIEASTRAAKVLKDNFPEVKEVVGKIGSGEIPTDPMPVEACDLMIILKDKGEWTSAGTREELADKMQAVLEQHVPGVTFGFQQPIQMRFNELMTGARQDVVVKVYGEDLEKLSAYAVKIGAIARKIDGAEDIYVEQVSGLPQVIIRFNRDKIAQFGLNVEDINTAIRTGFAGEVAGFVFEGEKRFDLVVRLEKVNRQSLDDVKNLYITAPNGNHIPLEQLAEVSFKAAPNQIQRDDAKRRIIVGFNTRGRDVESIVREIQSKIEQQMKFEPGYYPTYGGTFENLQAANKRLGIAVPAALFLIFFLLYLTFNSAKQALLIFTAIPLSAIGGLFALWLRGMPFSISAGVGFIALFGVAVLNGIVLIAEFNRLKKEGMTDLTAIVKSGTSLRLRPVIMTALVASLGFLPMALSGGSGGEVQKPLATVVIGGLLTATLLTLLLLPILYIWFEKIKPSGAKRTPVIAVLLFILTCGTVNAQTGPINRQQAIELALKNNPLMTNAGLEIGIQQEHKKAALEIPKTEFNMMYGQYNSQVKNDNNFSVSQTFPFPSVFGATAALGNAQLKGAQLKAAISKNELVLQVKQVYSSLQYLYELRKLLNKQDSINTGFVKSASLRYKTGESTLLEQTTAETQQNEIRNQLLLNEANISIYLSKLQVLLGLKTTVIIADRDLKAEDTAMVTDTAELKNNPLLELGKQQIEIAEKQKKLIGARSLPDITLGYFNQSLTGTQNVNGQEVFFDRMDRFQGLNIGLSIPLFFGAQKARVRSAELSRQQQVSGYESSENRLKGEYQQAIQEYQKNKNSLQYYQTSALTNATLILKNSKIAYQSGEMTYNEFLINLKNVNVIHENYLMALLQLNQSIHTLEYLSGKIN